MKVEIREYRGDILYEYNPEIVVTPSNYFFGLPASFDEATLPLSDTDKLIVRQGTEWKEVSKSEFDTSTGGLTSVGYFDLEDDLRATVNNGTNTTIDWALGVAFQLDELTSDTTINFENITENKQIKLILKGNVALSFQSFVNVDDIDYNGDEWNVIVFEATNINGYIVIKSFSL